MVYSFSSAAFLVGFVWIAVKLWRQILQTTVVVAILLMIYLLAKLVVKAVIGG